MSSTPNTKASSSKKNKPLMVSYIYTMYIVFNTLILMKKGNVVDFESVSLPSLKKYRSQFQIRIKPSVPKSELAAAIAEHFASIPVPEETEVIDQFFKALQKNRSGQSETEESSDEPVGVNTKKTNNSHTVSSDLKKRFKDHQEKAQLTGNNSDSSNSQQSNSKKTAAKRNSIPKVESKYLYARRVILIKTL